MTVELANHETLDCLGVRGGPVTYQGVTRDCLTFLFSPEADLAALMGKFTPETCKTLALDSGESRDIHEHYTLRVAAGTGCRALLEGQSAIAGAEGEQVSYVSMAQTTLAERQLLAQQEVLDGLLTASLEGGGRIV